MAIYPPGDARADWTILRDFSTVAGKTLPYNDLETLRARLEATNPVFTRLDILPRFGCTDTTGPSGGPAAIAAPLAGPAFTPTLANYYQTDPISRASPTMDECTATYITPPRAEAAE